MGTESRKELKRGLTKDWAVCPTAVAGMHNFVIFLISADGGLYKNGLILRIKHY